MAKMLPLIANPWLTRPAAVTATRKRPNPGRMMKNGQP